MTTQTLSHLRHVAFVIDSSQSARAFLNETWRSFLYLNSLLPPYTSSSVYVLGEGRPLSGNEIGQLGSGGLERLPSPCSLLAPVFQHLIEHSPRLNALILIGSGEIFDLDDWVGHFMVERWVLVRTGSDSLQRTGGGLPEISPNQLREACRLLELPPSSTRSSAPLLSGVSDLSSYLWYIDRAGYPMIRVEPLNCFVHLFPVTKMQFEKFILSAAGTDFNDEWYAARLGLNPRASYRNVSREDYEGLFATSITTTEVETFASWLKRGSESFSLLSVEEWKQSYQWLLTKKLTAPPPEVTELDALATWQFIQTQLSPQYLSDLALMSDGVMEWVVFKNSHQEKSYCGLGLPRAHFATQPFRTIFEPSIPFTDSPRNFGFRLRMR
jgi:hypothetical protein